MTRFVLTLALLFTSQDGRFYVTKVRPHEASHREISGEIEPSAVRSPSAMTPDRQARLRALAYQLTLALDDAPALTFGELAPRCKIALIDNPSLSEHTRLWRRPAYAYWTQRYSSRDPSGSWLTEAQKAYAEFNPPKASQYVNFLRSMLLYLRAKGHISGDHELTELAQIQFTPNKHWLSGPELARFDDALDEIADERRKMLSGVEALRACVYMPFRIGAVLGMQWSKTGGGLSTVSVFDKGKWRDWTIGGVMLELMQRRAQAVRGRSPYVFPGQTLARPVSKPTVWRLTKEAAERAGLDAEAVSPHTLRRSMANVLIEQGESVETVSTVLGHCNVQVTKQHYAFLTPPRARMAVIDFGRYVHALKRRTEGKVG